MMLEEPKGLKIYLLNKIESILLELIIKRDMLKITSILNILKLDKKKRGYQISKIDKDLNIMLETIEEINSNKVDREDKGLQLQKLITHFLLLEVEAYQKCQG
jgi:hypothetical protein